MLTTSAATQYTKAAPPTTPAPIAASFAMLGGALPGAGGAPAVLLDGDGVGVDDGDEEDDGEEDDDGDEEVGTGMNPKNVDGWRGGRMARMQSEYQ